MEGVYKFDMSYKKDCFGYAETPSGRVKCTKLKEIDCDGCKFYKTPEEFIESEKRAWERRWGKDGLRRLEELRKK